MTTTIPEKHYHGILTGEYISEVVNHSINKALSSARKYKLDEKALNEMYTEFILGVNCPADGSDLLVKYRMQKRINEDGIIEVYATSEKVKEGDVAVIGMSSRFTDEAQSIAQQAIEKGLCLKNEMIKFVKRAIVEVNNEGSFQISMPMVIKDLSNKRIVKTVIEE